MNWRDYLKPDEKATIKRYEAVKAEYELLHPKRMQAKKRAYAEMRYAQLKKK